MITSTVTNIKKIEVILLLLAAALAVSLSDKPLSSAEVCVVHLL